MTDTAAPVAPETPVEPTIELPVEPTEAEPVAPEVPVEPVVEPPKEALSPQMAQLAKRDKGLRERETKLKSDQAAYEKAVADHLASKGTAEELTKLLKSDLVTAAKRAEMTPEQMQEQARALWYASVGEKAPAEYQTNAKFREVQGELAALKAAREKDAKDREAERTQMQIDGTRRAIATGIHTYVTSAFEGAPMVRAYAEDNPKAVTEQLFNLAITLAQANPEADIPEPAALVKQLEAALEAEIAPLRKKGLVYDPKVTTPNVPEARAPSALTNQRAATASKSRTEALSEEERLKQAVREYEADLARA